MRPMSHGRSAPIRLILAALAAALLAACGEPTNGPDKVEATPWQPLPTPAPLLFRPQDCSALPANPDRLDVKVLLLVYNPSSGPAYGYRKLQEIYPTFPAIDPLVQDYLTDMMGAGRGAFCLEIAERFDLDELPPAGVERLVAPDGLVLIENYRWVSRDVYFKNVARRYGGESGEPVDLFNNGRADYQAILKDRRFGIPRKVDERRVDMVFVLAPPFTGFWEAAMAGPGAYWVNGGPIEDIPCDRRFVVLAHGLDRDVGLWLEVTAHMTENILGRVSRRWPKVWQYDTRGPFNDWERYQLTDRQNYGPELVVHGFAQIGTAHYPPNSPPGSDYAFAFEDVVESYADDWLTYPDFAGVKTAVNRETWNLFGGNYHRGFEYWWFAHIPHQPGSHDGVLNNWWRYIYDVNRDPDALAAE